MNYSEALSYIHSINWTFCKPGLERIGELCQKLGDPQNDLKFIHVAGTNGKGSFCAMLDSILREVGYKVGLFTSPYVKEFNERIRFDGKNIEDSELAEVTEFVKQYADEMRDKPTEFELITAIGFEYFKRKKCDVVVLEAGMGGRLDSTNIIKNALLSVITGISLEHTAFLGDTVAKIAAEKAGIIKNGVPVIFGGESKEAAEVIRKRALELSSEYHFVDKSSLEVTKADLGGSEFLYEQRKGLRLSLLGLYQPRNAANVICALDILKKEGLSITEEALRKGLEKTVWHARFERISEDPLVIFDGAHNPEGIECAVNSIKHYFGSDKVLVLSGVMKDKDYSYIAGKLSEVAECVFTITPDNPRALDAKSYAEVFASMGIEARSFDGVKEALSSAVKTAKDRQKALVCLGSLYMYKEITDNLL